MNTSRPIPPNTPSAVNATKTPIFSPLPPDSSEPAEIVAVVVRGYN